MALRLMQIFLPKDRENDSNELLADREVLGRWRDSDSEQTVLHLLVPAEETEPIMDQFEQHYANLKGFHVVLFPVEAVLPRPKIEKSTEPVDVDKDQPESNGLRVSREELYTEANESLGINRFYMGMTVLSAVVAAVGLIRDDVAVIIGAMVIAPLLGPNVALALATTLGDVDLIKRAIKTNLAGVIVAFGFSLLVGLVFPVDPDVQAIQSRTQTGFGDVLLALAAGMAGTLAFTRGQAGAVIGVMVAVALVPPVVVCGMLLASGHTQLAFGAGLLTAANVICVNLAGVLTFLLQGLRPRTWWETKKAERSIRLAMAIWSFLLIILILILWFGGIGFRQ